MEALFFNRRQQELSASEFCEHVTISTIFFSFRIVCDVVFRVLHLQLQVANFGEEGTKLSIGEAVNLTDSLWAIRAAKRMNMQVK
mgnify:CR=1 FL=1